MLKGQFSHFGYPANIFGAISIGETQIAVQAVTQVVAVKVHGVVAQFKKAPLHLTGDG